MSHHSNLLHGGGSSEDVTFHSCTVPKHQTLCLHYNLDNTTKRRKLELLSQYSLFGNIECLQAVRLAGNSRDSLLLSFKDAKVHHRYNCTCLIVMRN